MTTLTAIILTFNEARHILDCIESLRFADRIVVFDSLSRDRTAELAREAGAEVLTRPFDDYASQRNAALDAVQGRTDWVLFIDADERVSAELAEEIRESMSYPRYAGFRIPRHNYIFGRLTLGAGWFPDYQTRLLRAGAARYDPAQRVHERVLLHGEEGTLRHPLIHHNYDTLRQFIDKQTRYTALYARMALEAGERPRPRQFVTLPVRHFWWRFVTLHGYRDGLHGLTLSLLMAWYELVRLRMVRRLWEERDYDAGR
jgi:glycosyltransferase involved in cell wall biosynthesis